jgi:hypothetical protein
VTVPVLPLPPTSTVTVRGPLDCKSLLIMMTRTLPDGEYVPQTEP